MKKQIRRGCFETNSSSQHSLSISKEGLEPSKFKLNRNGKIEVDFGEFGKRYEIFDTQYEKLSYLMTCLWYLSGGFNVEDIYNNYEFRRIERVVCDYAGATGIEILGEMEPKIDHQSVPEYEIEIINSWDEDAVINIVNNNYVRLKTDCD